MFDIGWAEMMVIGVLALIVVGPKDLPKVFKQVTYWIKKLRGLANEFQSGVDDMVREADLEDAKKIFDTTQDFSPQAQLKRLVTNDPDDNLEDVDLEKPVGTFDPDEYELYDPVEAKKIAPTKTKADEEAIEPTVEPKALNKSTTTKKPAAKKTPAKKTQAKKAVKPSKVEP